MIARLQSTPTLVPSTAYPSSYQFKLSTFPVLRSTGPVMAVSWNRGSSFKWDSFRLFFKAVPKTSMAALGVTCMEMTTCSACNKKDDAASITSPFAPTNCHWQQKESRCVEGPDPSPTPSPCICGLQPTCPTATTHPIPGTILRSCGLAGCTTSDCCALNPYCSATVQCNPASSYQPPNFDSLVCPSAMCADNAAPCCVNNQQCSTYSCPAGSIRNTYGACAGTECSEERCCYRPETCLPKVFFPAVDCGVLSNYTLSYRPALSAILCATPLACTIDECCRPPVAPVMCTRAVCLPGGTSSPTSTVKPAFQSIACAGGVCRMDECCDPNQTCQSFVCPSGYRTRGLTTYNPCSTALCQLNGRKVVFVCFLFSCLSAFFSRQGVD